MNDIAGMIAAAPVSANRLDLDLANLPRNDYGNAMRMLKRFGADLLYVDEVGWHVWDGKRWSAEAGQYRAMTWAHQTAESIRDEARALQAEYDAIILMPKPERPFGFSHKIWAKRIEGHFGFAVASGNTAKAEAMLKAAIPYKRVMPEKLDSNIWLLNVQNGTLDLRAETGEAMPGVVLRKHRREDMLTLLADVEYDPQANCPLWDKVVERVLPNVAVRTFQQTYLGLCLTGVTSEQKMCIQSGVGANGKSTMMEAVGHVLGDYSVTVPIQTFMFDDRRSGANASPDIARLPGKRLALSSEPEVGQRLSESVVKQITGGEVMTCRHLHKGFFEFTPHFKLALSVNIKPNIQGQDHGIWRRINIIPYDVVIPDAERDLQLSEKLKAEYSGILNWLLAGLGFWMADGRLVTPDEVKMATEDYRAASQPISQFPPAAIRPCKGGHVGATRLFELYKEWCEVNAIEAVNQTKFGRLMDNLGYKKVRVGTVFYVDIELAVTTFKPAKDDAGADSSDSVAADGAPIGADPRPEPPPPDG